MTVIVSSCFLLCVWRVDCTYLLASPTDMPASTDLPSCALRNSDSSSGWTVPASWAGSVQLFDGRGWGCGVGPVAVSRGDFEAAVLGRAQDDGVETRMGRWRLEAEDVAVGDVVGDGGKIAFEALGVAQLEVLAACEPRHGFGDVLLQAIEGGDGGRLGEAQRRREQAEAVVRLFGGILFQVDVGIVGIAAHAAVSRAGS